MIELEDEVCFGELPSSFAIEDCFNKFETLGIFIFGNAGVKLMEGGSCLIMTDDVMSDLDMAVTCTFGDDVIPVLLISLFSVVLSRRLMSNFPS